METSKFYLAAGSLRACPFGENPDRNFCILAIISLLPCCVLQVPKWISINKACSSDQLSSISILRCTVSPINRHFFNCSSMSLHTRVSEHLTLSGNPVTLWDSFFQDFRKSCTVGSNSCVHWIGQEEWAGYSAIPSQTNKSSGSSTSPNKTSNHFTTWLYITCIGGHWRFPHMEIQSC